MKFWGSNNSKPKITNSQTLEYYGLVDIRNSNVEFHNLHIDGQDFTTTRDGLQFYNSVGLIDNCDLDDFSFSPVSVAQESTMTVSNSFIHDSDQAGIGYGIVVSGGSTLIAHDNIFDNNRHHIAGGDSESNLQPSYYIYDNTFEDSTTYPEYTGSAVDMHGQAHYAGASGVLAGRVMEVYNNVFNDPEGVAIGIRGKPQVALKVHGNTFAHDWLWYWNQENTRAPAIQLYPESVVEQSFPYKAFGNFYIGDNTYSGVDPPYYWDQWESVFEVQYNGHWNKLAAMSNTVDVSDMIFGDFNGDNVTDLVVNKHPVDSDALAGWPEGSDVSGQIYISWGGLILWKVLNVENYPTTSLDVADVDGDGKSDLIHNQVSYSSGGHGPWTALPNSFDSYQLYTARDFNGDGINDNYRVSRFD